MHPGVTLLYPRPSCRLWSGSLLQGHCCKNTKPETSPHQHHDTTTSGRADTYLDVGDGLGLRFRFLPALSRVRGRFSRLE